MTLLLFFLNGIDTPLCHGSCPATGQNKPQKQTRSPKAPGTSKQLGFDPDLSTLIQRHARSPQGCLKHTQQTIGTWLDKPLRAALVHLLDARLK